MVPADGPLTAKIALVGEAPGDAEVAGGRPFIGPAGKLLDGMLEEAGIRREECYITNLLQEQPDASAASSKLRNDFGVLYEDSGRKSPSSRLLTNVERVRLELQQVAPHVIVALGNEPLRWLTGKQGIGDWRGSVVDSEINAPYMPGAPSSDVNTLLSTGIKVLPTYHPAAILRQWDWRPIAVFDLKKALSESTTSTITRRPRHTTVGESIDQVMPILTQLAAPGAPIAFDIEVETQQVSSLALAASPEEALVIPIFWGPTGSKWAPDDEEVLWETLADLFATHPMIGQNVHYDLTFLRMYNVYATRIHMDTMVAFHVLYPELPKGLEFMTSLYTDQPYYKWMRTTSDEQEFYRYNGLDALVTYECAGAIEQELREA